MYTYLEQTTETGDDGTLKLLLFWRVQYNTSCAVRPRVQDVATLIYTLYPSNKLVPIAKDDEYNVTIAICENEDTENTTEVNVTLSLLLNDNVLQHVPFIRCLITRTGYGDIESKVHLPLHANQSKPTAGQEIPHTCRTTGSIRTEPDINKFTDDCVPCSASLRHFQVLQLCIVSFFIANMLCEVVG